MMRLLFHIMMLMLVWILVPMPSLACDRGDPYRRGFYYYCDDIVIDPKPIEEEEETSPPPHQASYTERLEQFRADELEARARAVLDPTPANVKSFMEINQQIAFRASKFSDVWKEVLYDSPSLDINTKYPLTNLGQQLRYDKENSREDAALLEMASSGGLLFVFSGGEGCAFCLQQADILKILAEESGIIILPLSLDGQPIPQFPDPFVDNGQIEQFGLSENLSVPLVGFINLKDSTVKRMGAGLLTIDQIKEAADFFVNGGFYAEN